jgi:hypothetical protein
VAVSRRRRVCRDAGRHVVRAGAGVGADERARDQRPAARPRSGSRSTTRRRTRQPPASDADLVPHRTAGLSRRVYVCGPEGWCVARGGDRRRRTRRRALLRVSGIQGVVARIDRVAARRCRRHSPPRPPLSDNPPRPCRVAGESSSTRCALATMGSPPPSPRPRDARQS